MLSFYYNCNGYLQIKNILSLKERIDWLTLANWVIALVIWGK
jgi:hypothetical protein